MCVCVVVGEWGVWGRVNEEGAANDTAGKVNKSVNPPSHSPGQQLALFYLGSSSQFSCEFDALMELPIPLLKNASVFQSSRKGYGMIDFAKYTNSQEDGKDNNNLNDNVTPHCDPGLFSMSFGSTAPGLEMFDPETEEWISVTNDRTVFWLGSAASEITGGRLKSGEFPFNARKILFSWWY